MWKLLERIIVDMLKVSIWQELKHVIASTFEKNMVELESRRNLIIAWQVGVRGQYSKGINLLINIEEQVVKMTW